MPICLPVQVLEAVGFDSIPSQSHLLLQIEVTDLESFQQYRVVFASQDAAVAVFQRAVRKGGSQLGRLFDTTASSASTASVAGHLFEVMTLLDLRTQHCKYHCRKLEVCVTPQTTTSTDGSSGISSNRSGGSSLGFMSRFQQHKVSKVSMQPAEELRLFAYTIASFDSSLSTYIRSNIGALTKRILLQPQGNTYPEIDGVMLPGGASGSAELDHIDLFQITISCSRCLDLGKLGRILSALPSAHKYVLYFVVPEGVMASFKVTTQGRATGQHQQRIGQLKVYVISKEGGTRAWAEPLPTADIS